MVGFAGGGSGALIGVGVAAGIGFFAVMGANADFVTGGFGGAVLKDSDVAFSLRWVAAASVCALRFSETEPLSLALVALSGLGAVRTRVDDDLAAGGFADLRTAGALGAFDLVVVFVAIKTPQKNRAHGRERLGETMIKVRQLHDAPPHIFRAPFLHPLQGCQQGPGPQRRVSLPGW